MLNRLKTALCHPSRLGFFYKDKLSTPILYVVGFLLALIGILFMSHVNESYFTREDARYATGLVSRLEYPLSLEFKDKALAGEAASLQDKYIDIYFLDTSVLPKNEDKISMYFNSLEVSIYDGAKRVNSYSYNRASFNDFSLEAVRQGDRAAGLELESLILQALASTNSYFINLNALYMAIAYLVSYLFVLLFVGLFSYFTNQDLTMAIRMKICLYCTLIYPLMAILSICFKISFLEIIGLMLPIFYCRSAFSRIVRVRIKKN